ncbi:MULTISPECIES: elongation factor P maturation arginine rhamnosyltransferase EarP [Cupriavidus]|uniref:Protein-arginine rhamnosyltransferase n=1 Tax=Cupriavidus pinatubonensis (strain JMP 134 / LMG 1197) TaxID=264198 RepID=Q46Z25_CUPPJ|nr:MULTISPECIES: elongation factor P maturation arginine rhamnosyltransferase EarP [Cupriavidus]QYY30532.1 elongation factor P maturation arginine rhamnosyltransferase EarP [Cupriavidus pinatubonensis]TPQ35691.1 elongation factor P maturation arginine rhamnosyltransferase EarP [Cupriavidus pinatubonensis]
MPIRSWDIFCTVIDNFGDIGVCWRLARQLAQEHGHAVRLWVDDLHSFARLAPTLDTAARSQHLSGVEIRTWRPGGDADDRARFADVTVHDAVIEAFACHLPDVFLARMVARELAPAWINLEYLSAEPWVREHHGMPSPHPRLPLVKHFFFPGFERGTGGLLRESMLGAQRSAFLAGPAAQAALWHRLRATPDGSALKISLFSYQNPALPVLLEQWRDGPEPVQCLIPQGLAAEQWAAWSGEAAVPGKAVTRGNLQVNIVPFVRQEHYDEMLWACDLNFVRGEDSFVRAQWAARPLVWHIYPQDEDAHHDKLDAWLTLFGRSGVDAGAAQALTAFWHAWNAYGNAPDWAALRSKLPALTQAAQQWQARLLGLGDLAANLVAFCENRVK